MTGWIDEGNEGDERNDAEILIQELAEKLIKLVFEDLKLDFCIPDS